MEGGHLKLHMKYYFYRFPNPIQVDLVPKLTLGPFLTLNVRNGHKLKDCVFRIPAHIENKNLYCKTKTNILLSTTRTTIHNLNIFSEIKIIKGVLFILKPLTVFKTNPGFPFSNIILNLNHCRVFETKPAFITIPF